LIEGVGEQGAEYVGQGGRNKEGGEHSATRKFITCILDEIQYSIEIEIFTALIAMWYMVQ
jgi:hypothetical protein